MFEIIIVISLVSGTISLVSFGKAAQHTIILHKRR